MYSLINFKLFIVVTQRLANTCNLFYSLCVKYISLKTEKVFGVEAVKQFKTSQFKILTKN